MAQTSCQAELTFMTLCVTCGDCSCPSTVDSPTVSSVAGLSSCGKPLCVHHATQAASGSDTYTAHSCVQVHGLLRCSDSSFHIRQAPSSECHVRAARWCRADDGPCKARTSYSANRRLPHCRTPVLAAFFMVRSKGLNSREPSADPLVKAPRYKGRPAACGGRELTWLSSNGACKRRWALFTAPYLWCVLACGA